MRTVWTAVFLLSFGLYAHSALCQDASGGAPAVPADALSAPPEVATDAAPVVPVADVPLAPLADQAPAADVVVPAEAAPTTAEPVAAPAAPPVMADATGTQIGDAYSEQSFKCLLLDQGTTSATGIPAQFAQRYSSIMRESRYDTQNWQINGPVVGKWCYDATAEAQTVRGDINPATNQPNITNDAVIDRCSPVYDYWFEIAHVCEVKTVKEKKKTVTYAVCKINTNLFFRRYVPAITESGTIAFTQDTSVGQAGVLTLTDSSEGSCEIDAKTDFSTASMAALDGASMTGALFLTRKVREIRDFQLHAPIIKRDGAWAKACLDNEMVALDTPFYVVVNTASGEQRKGFAKAREIFDGCVLTPKLAEREAAGKKVQLDPMKAEVIIGRSNVKQGMTMWEMPSIGLDFGLGGGIVPVFGGGLAPAVSIITEYNLGAKIGISELFTFLRVSAGFVSDTAKLKAAFIDSYPQGADLSDVTIALQGDLGLLKRFYFLGRWFFELGAGVAFSYYPLGEKNDYTFHLWGIGGEGQIGLGAQLAPRFMVRALGSYRYLAAKPGVEDADGESIEGRGGVNSEKGITAGLDILYTF